jgi:two-component system sensor histidine kinase KdpD
MVNSTHSHARQYLLSTAFIVLVAALCFAFSSYISYQVVAFILMVAVSLIAVSFDIAPVLVAAILSAAIWDFFFIPPFFAFHVNSQQDVILLLMYFLIALVNAVLTYRIRRAEKLAMQREEKANTIRLYNTLLNSLSHELRTPIAAIVGATDNLQDANARLTALQRYELMAEISKASFRLNQQVENLLNMSRLESGIIKPRPDWCDITELVYDVVNRVEDNKPVQQIGISIPPEIPLFRLDKGLLEQIVYNLIANAIRYIPENGKIDISAACHADVLELTVEDNGPGFPQQEIEQVFDKFYQLSNAKPGGTGLGLSIVRGFTEAMHGSVELRNKSSGGARFTISIPAETSYLKNLNND